MGFYDTINALYGRSGRSRPSYAVSEETRRYQEEQNQRINRLLEDTHRERRRHEMDRMIPERMLR